MGGARNRLRTAGELAREPVVAGCQARVGLAPTKFSARLAARGAPPGGVEAVDGWMEEVFLRDRPVAHLPPGAAEGCIRRGRAPGGRPARARLPDGAPAVLPGGAIVSRLPETPTPVDVEPGEGGAPAVLRWELRERVVDVVSRWRVDADWWREPVSRMYYLVLKPSALLEVFEDLIAGGWYLERVRD